MAVESRHTPVAVVGACEDVVTITGQNAVFVCMSETGHKLTYPNANRERPELNEGPQHAEFVDAHTYMF